MRITPKGQVTIPGSFVLRPQIFVCHRVPMVAFGGSGPGRPGRLHLTTTIKGRAERHANMGVTLIASDLLRRAPTTNRESLHRAAPQAEPAAGA